MARVGEGRAEQQAAEPAGDLVAATHGAALSEPHGHREHRADELQKEPAGELPPTASTHFSPYANQSATRAAAIRWTTIIGACADMSAIKWWIGSVGVVWGMRVGAREGVLERPDPAPVHHRKLGETHVVRRGAVEATLGSPT